MRRLYSCTFFVTAGSASHACDRRRVRGVHVQCPVWVILGTASNEIELLLVSVHGFAQTFANLAHGFRKPVLGPGGVLRNDNREATFSIAVAVQALRTTLYKGVSGD